MNTFVSFVHHLNTDRFLHPKVTYKYLLHFPTPQKNPNIFMLPATIPESKAVHSCPYYIVLTIRTTVRDYRCQLKVLVLDVAEWLENQHSDNETLVQNWPRNLNNISLDRLFQGVLSLTTTSSGPIARVSWLCSTAAQDNI